MKSKLIALFFILLLVIFFFFVKFIATKKINLFENDAVKIQQQVIKECAGLGNLTGKEVKDCEDRVQSKK
jgi:hypothetical protein